MTSTHRFYWNYNLHHPHWKTVNGRLCLEQRPSESMQHLMMKICSYFIFYHPQLMIEQSAHQRHKPDLIRTDDTGLIVEWIDCGSTHLKKLKRISNLNHSTMITIVKKHKTELAFYQRKAYAYVNRPERLQFQTYTHGFIDELSHYAHDRSIWEVTLLKEQSMIKHLYIDINHHHINSEIFWNPFPMSSLLKKR